MTLKRWIFEMKIPKGDVADRLGITRQHLSAILREGKRRQIPSRKLARRIARETGWMVTEEELLYPEGRVPA